MDVKLTDHGTRYPVNLLDIREPKYDVMIFDVTPCDTIHQRYLVNWVVDDTTIHQLEVDSALGGEGIKQEFFIKLFDKCQVCTLIDAHAIWFLKRHVYTGMFGFKNINCYLSNAYNLLKAVWPISNGFPTLNTLIDFFFSKNARMICNWNYTVPKPLIGVLHFVKSLRESETRLFWSTRHHATTRKWLGWLPSSTPIDNNKHALIKTDTLLREYLKRSGHIQLAPQIKRISLALKFVSVEGFVFCPPEYDPHLQSDRGIKLCILGYLCSFRPYGLSYEQEGNSWIRFQTVVDLLDDDVWRQFYDQLKRCTLPKELILKAVELLFGNGEQQADHLAQVLWKYTVDVHKRWAIDSHNGTYKSEPVMGFWDMNRPYIRTKEALTDVGIVDAQHATLETTMRFLGPILDIDFSMVDILPRNTEYLFDDRKFSYGNPREIFLFQVEQQDLEVFMCGVALRQKSKIF